MRRRVGERDAAEAVFNPAWALPFPLNNPLHRVMCGGRVLEHLHSGAQRGSEMREVFSGLLQALWDRGKRRALSSLSEIEGALHRDECFAG